MFYIVKKTLFYKGFDLFFIFCCDKIYSRYALYLTLRLGVRFYMEDKSKKFSWFATTWFATHHILESDLTSPDFKFLFYVLNQMDRNNEITLSKYKELGETLSLGERTVSQSVKRLKDLDIISKTSKPKTFMVNPSFFYTGGATAQNELNVIYKRIRKDNLEKISQSIPTYPILDSPCS